MAFKQLHYKRNITVSSSTCWYNNAKIVTVNLHVYCSVICSQLCDELNQIEKSSEEETSRKKVKGKRSVCGNTGTTYWAPFV